MIDMKIREVVSNFTEEAKLIYGEKLSGVILYGSCARGEQTPDSDIDLLLLLTVRPQKIGVERNKIFDISDKLDRQYDVVLAPVFQSADVYHKYMSVSAFYQNIQREGVRFV